MSALMYLLSFPRSRRPRTLSLDGPGWRALEDSARACAVHYGAHYGLDFDEARRKGREYHRALHAEAKRLGQPHPAKATNAEVEQLRARTTP